MSLYDKLYEVAASNMREAGDELECNKRVFLHLIQTSPSEADISKIMDLNQRDFEDAAFLLCIHRMPSKNEREYAIRDCLSEDSFKKKVLQNIVRMPAFASARVTMKGNPYFHTEKSGNKLYTAIGGAADSPRVRAVFKRLPKWLQKKLRGRFQ